MSLGWAIAALLAWATVLLLPWRPWSTRERLEADASRSDETLDDVSVLIPARNEAGVIGKTLASLAHQGPGLEILIVDDQSSDGTGEAVEASGVAGVRVISGASLPEGWVAPLRFRG